MSIGERIISLRNEHNISQAQLARAMNVSRQAVSKWENDLSSPDTVRLIQLADVLNTDVEFLATGNHSKIKSEPQIVPVYHPIERIVEVEKRVEVDRIVEKPVVVERIIEVEKPVASKPKVKIIKRTKYLRNPIEFGLTGIAGFLLGILTAYLIFA